MRTCKQTIGLLLGLGALVLSVPNAQAGPNLPVFTSPVDVTGWTLDLQVWAPQRDTGQPVQVTQLLPPTMIPSNFAVLNGSVLSTKFDQFWNGPDPKTGKTVRTEACDGVNGINGIKQQVSDAVAKEGETASKNISCNLATKGQLLAQQGPNGITLAYLLTNNTVLFSTTAFCTPACPGPEFSVTFAFEIVTTISTPTFCGISANAPTVFVVSANMESANTTSALMSLVAGQKFTMAEEAITSAVQKNPAEAVSLDSSLSAIRTSDLCTGKIAGGKVLASAFRDATLQLESPESITLRVDHLPIQVPSVSVPNPGAPVTPSTPSLQPPLLSTQPMAKAGTAAQIQGLYFPPNANLSTSLPVNLTHGGFGPNSILLNAGPCLNIAGGGLGGGDTELEWGPAGALRTEKLAGDAQGRCASHFDANDLTPNSGYQFRARDCDVITCSPWSPIVRVTTANTNPNSGKVFLGLDGRVALGTGTVDAQGRFTTMATIPANTAAGTHKINAVDGTARADVDIQVTAAAGPSKATIMVVGVLQGETGCPPHPITSTQTDAPFMLFGSGFAPGTVTIHLDTATGTSLGMPTTQADGSICANMAAVPGSGAGAHELVAVQNGAVAAQAVVAFVLPSPLNGSTGSPSGAAGVAKVRIPRGFAAKHFTQ